MHYDSTEYRQAVANLNLAKSHKQKLSAQLQKAMGSERFRLGREIEQANKEIQECSDNLELIKSADSALHQQRTSSGLQRALSR
ncbi:hypothetical protein [Vibrio coralliilyticus]|uniref:hypothetical protein n=1 Tax=Vibrio coralliilyticus TaxID=190893 RepID=UPI000BAACB1B|nr:hypothetical protein [Vibrio coralliilyticus]NOI57797.1 hypothetical protein [Vibrio coralliilyticus]PAT69739.1 hypothetical protein CKA27_02970 [Vibrio coralliilyticus]